MLENVGRKVTTILLLLLVAILCMALPSIREQAPTSPFRMGLDLQGGTRMVLSFPFEEALKEGKITEAEFADKAGLMQQFTGIIRERVDPTGVHDPIIRSEGLDRVVIELPGTAELASAGASDALQEAIGAGDRTLALASTDAADLRAFPATGGVVRIGQEKIRYDRRRGAILSGLKRGESETEAAAHAGGELIVLYSDDAIRRAIMNVGEMRFFIEAKAGDVGAGSDLTAERERVLAWLVAHPGEPVSHYNRLDRDAGGPWPGIHWAPRRQKAEEETLPVENRLVALKVQKDEWNFTGNDLKTVTITQDQMGFPAVGFEMEPMQRRAFGDFTEEHVGEGMAIVLNGEITTLATINERLPGGGQISGGAGGFTLSEVKEMVTSLRSGSLRIKPVLEAEERVGASLGDEYVSRGAISAGLGILMVLVFILFYYRRLGVAAAISLIANLVLMMGAMAFLRATLTLPGVAGIILTVGMAVDANILIYERIREETLKGRKVLQSAKNGFERALVTIVDANLTTLITALILYKFGTGPVRGFATTLSVGIITSMFSALVITRVLVHRMVEGGIKEFSMARLVKESRIDFMGLAPKALVGSLILIVGGVGLFASLEDKDKLSIDFLGGFTLTARTESPQPVDDIRGLVRTIPGTIGDSVEVKPILRSEAPGGGFTQFRLTYKAEVDGTVQAAAQAETGETGEGEIREALAAVLQKGPVELEVNDGLATGSLYFEENHSADDVRTALEEIGLTEVQATSSDPGATSVFAFSAQAQQDQDADILTTLINGKFKNLTDSAQQAYRLASPIPESSVVGAQVVGELRDKAIFAILVSLFAVVLYIRARFAEYSYGFAAVVALVHDVLITLGCLALAIMTDLVEAEISLPMIAAFLTIIGYSLNDTIVVFDRVRENKPRMKGALSDTLNTSINQTLSRTVLTSITTLLTVMILLGFNLGTRNVLEGFAFALSIGVLVGTYSSMFVACPTFLWLENRAAKKEAASAAS